MSEDNFLLSDTIKSKKIILNEKDLSEDISSLHVVASTNTGGEASDEDVSSLAAVDSALSHSLGQDISSLTFSENSNANSISDLEESISSLSVKEIGSTEQVLVDYSLGQDSDIFAEYRINESTAGLTNISDSLSISADATLGDDYVHVENYTLNGIDVSLSQNISITIPSVLNELNSELFISYAFLFSPTSSITGSSTATFFRNGGVGLDYFVSSFTNPGFIERRIQSGGNSVLLETELSFITVRQSGQISILNNGNRHSFSIESLDFSRTNRLYHTPVGPVGLPYTIMGRNYSLIDKVEWYLANQLNAIDSLPSTHTYKDTAPEGLTSEQFVTTDAFFSSFYQDYLQLKETVSSLSGS